MYIIGLFLVLIIYLTSLDGPLIRAFETIRDPPPSGNPTRQVMPISSALVLQLAQLHSGPDLASPAIVGCSLHIWKKCMTLRCCWHGLSLIVFRWGWRLGFSWRLLCANNWWLFVLTNDPHLPGFADAYEQILSLSPGRAVLKLALYRWAGKNHVRRST